MPKTSAIGDKFFVGAYDLSGDVGSVQSVNVTRAVLEVTGIDQAAPHRILGRGDGEMSFSAWHNPTAGQSHPVLDAMPTTDVICTLADGTSAGDAAASLIGKQVNYDSIIGADGSYVHDVTVKSNGYAVEWGRAQAAGVQSFIGTAQGGTVDGSAQSTSGGAAYLHLFSIGSGTVTISVQDSADGSTGWANVTGLVFTATPSITSERVATAAGATIKRYTRINASNPSGGTATAFVNFVRY